MDFVFFFKTLTCEIKWNNVINYHDISSYKNIYGKVSEIK